MMAEVGGAVGLWLPVDGKSTKVRACKPQVWCFVRAPGGRATLFVLDIPSRTRVASEILFCTQR